MVPTNYQEWLGCLEKIAGQNVSFEYIDQMKYGSCPGIQTVEDRFNDRIVETVNKMLSRMTKQCTCRLNEMLEEGDFSETEVVFRRSYKEMEKCRFYREISFLNEDFVVQLDQKVVAEKQRYWKEVYNYLTKIAEETEQSEIYDMLFYLKRLSN